MSAGSRVYRPETGEQARWGLRGRGGLRSRLPRRGLAWHRSWLAVKGPKLRFCVSSGLNVLLIPGDPGAELKPESEMRPGQMLFVNGFSYLHILSSFHSAV